MKSVPSTAESATMVVFLTRWEGAEEVAAALKTCVSVVINGVAAVETGCDPWDGSSLDETSRLRNLIE